jgi:O-acetyl-ADP-ribose deacetylase (regulator of RNase III)
MSKDIYFEKSKFIRLITSNIEYNSSTAKRAREYLLEEGLDADRIVAEGLSRIGEIRERLKLSGKVTPISADKSELVKQNEVKKKRRWTHESVLKLMAESGTEDPVEEIKARARELVLRGFELGWEGPPYSPIRLAEYLGIDVKPNDSVLDARIVPQKKGFQIQYNPFQRPTRINFSVSHEIAHTLFSDCGEAIRNRENSPMENRELEQLCNAAAAEIQLPYAIFSHDANAAPPSIEGLIDLATKYKASLESVFIRYTEVIDTSCAVLFGIFQNENKVVVDYYKASKHFPLSLPDGIEIPVGSKVHECTSPGWTARERVEWDILGAQAFNLFAVGISSYRRDKKPRVAMLLLPATSIESSVETGKVVLEIGDATKPRGAGKKIIAQVVNTSAALGRGFGYSLAKNYPVVKEELKKWHANKSSYQLGNSNLVKVNDKLFVFQMLAQKGIFPKGNEIPLKYSELRKCLIELRETAKELDCSIHMPAIGAGNAGGDWNIIIGMIHDELVNFYLKVNIYLLQGKPFNPKERTTLTLFKEDSTWGTEK